MCRLFALSSAPHRRRAMFWLLQAPDSLSAQSRRDPDGTGLGYYDAEDRPHLHKAPLAAYEDRRFAEEAADVTSTTFLAHVRYASTGELTRSNTHPFLKDGRLFAHNGVIEGLDELDAHLGADRNRVHGDTDSERFFALVSREADARSGDVAAGVTAAASWVAARLPVYSLNFVLTTPRELWAFRYPDTHGLYVLPRAVDETHRGRELEHRGTAGRMRVNSSALAAAPSVVVASERMDDDPRWRLLEPGELLHVGPELTTSSTRILRRGPAHRLTAADLGAEAAASQAAG